jgi:hypothetical protein
MVAFLIDELGSTNIFEKLDQLVERCYEKHGLNIIRIDLVGIVTITPVVSHDACNPDRGQNTKRLLGKGCKNDLWGINWGFQTHR